MVRKIEEDGDESIENDDAEEDEDDAYIPLRHHAWCGLVFLGYRRFCLLIVACLILPSILQIVVSSIIEDAGSGYFGVSACWHSR